MKLQMALEMLERHTANPNPTDQVTYSVEEVQLMHQTFTRFREWVATELGSLKQQVKKNP